MSAAPSKTFLVCHGAWSAGWAWKKMHPLMHAAGHRLVTPTYTGLGERAHLAHPGIDLDAHIEDMLDASHSPNVTAAEALMALLQKIAASGCGCQPAYGLTLRHPANKLANR